MATQTFTAGQILTAAQLTTLQSNSGLQHITGASFSAATSVSLPNGTFSTAYDNYRIILTLTALTTDSTFTMRTRASGTDNSAVSYITAQGGPNVGSTFTYSVTNEASAWPAGESDATVLYSLVMDIMNPQKTSITYMTGNYFYVNQARSNIFSIGGSGAVNNTTSYDSLSFISNQANSMTGKYQVYGYSIG
jgi:hypothetical protein